MQIMSEGMLGWCRNVTGLNEAWNEVCSNLPAICMFKHASKHTHSHIFYCCVSNHRPAIIRRVDRTAGNTPCLPRILPTEGRGRGGRPRRVAMSAAAVGEGRRMWRRLMSRET